MRSLKCGCRWNGSELCRCGRHREAGSLAVDIEKRLARETADVLAAEGKEE